MSLVKKIAQKSPGPPSHHFNTLSAHYCTIGQALLLCEEFGLAHWFGLPGRSSSSRKQAEFQENVSFVSVEILESYLEDLLDRDVSEETLCIRRRGILPPLNWFALGGILTSLSSGLYTASTGVPLSVSLALTIVLSSPFVIMWHISPGWGVARRMLFAQIVSQEVTRRRGGSHIGTLTTPWGEPRHAMSALFEGGSKRSSRIVAQKKGRGPTGQAENVLSKDVLCLSSARKQ